MVGLILQERILGATLGGLLMGGFVLQQRRGIYRSISEDGSQPKFSYVPKDHLFGAVSEVDLVHLWNKSVDGMLGPVIKFLSSRGW